MKRKVGLVELDISAGHNLLCNEIIDFVSLLAIGVTKKEQGCPREANLSRLCLGVEIKQREPKDLR